MAPFQYSQNEKIIMAIFTGASNFTSFPALFLMYLYERPFEFYIGLFTMITSFLYHVCESIDYNLYMEPGKWHQLDNIGSICCLNSLIISLMSSYRNHPHQLKLNLFSLFFVLILQIKDPWDLFNTLFPIIVHASLLFHDYYKHGIPKYNRKIMLRGVSILIIAISMFIRGLDDETDYLRIYHSIWHVTIGISTFYLWQIQEHRMVGIFQVFEEAYKRFFEILPQIN
jgi:hypothetical protein